MGMQPTAVSNGPSIPGDSQHGFPLQGVMKMMQERNAIWAKKQCPKCAKVQSINPRSKTSQNIK